MVEQRSYFRIRTAARVALRPVAEPDVAALRRRIRHRYVPAALLPGALDETRLSAELRVGLELLQRVYLALERIDQRLERLEARDQGLATDPAPACATEITLSGSGFSGVFGVSIPPGQLAEVWLDLWETGLPLVHALARSLGALDEEEGRRVTAFGFEELLADDLERIVRLSLRSQSQTLRARAEEGAR